MIFKRLRAWLSGASTTIRNRASRPRRAPLAVELLEDRTVPSTLTIITHGRQDQLALTPSVAPAWAFDMASAINVRDHLGYTETQIDHSVIRYDQPTMGVPVGGAQDFIIFNWAEKSDIDSPGVADGDQIAGTLAQLVRNRIPTTGTLDIHFIGHSRGTYVNLAAINRLNNAADNAHIGHIEMTTLDPQDYSLPGFSENLTFTVPSNVTQADNYYQYSFPLGGGHVTGATNTDLTLRLVPWSGRPLYPNGGDHQEVTDWYFWTLMNNEETQTISYLRDADLKKQNAQFISQYGSSVGLNYHDLLYKDDPLGQLAAALGLDGLLRTSPEEIVNGVTDYIDSVNTNIQDRFADLDLPVVGAKLLDRMQPFFDSLDNLKAQATDMFHAVLSLVPQKGGPSMTEMIQGALFLVLGPGQSGLGKLSPELQTILAPYAPEKGLNILKDNNDDGNDIGPSDIVVSTGFDRDDNDNPIANTSWIQFDVWVGQRFYVDVPFDIGAGLSEKMPGLGFDLSSENGVRFDFRWDARLGVGKSQMLGTKYYINAGAVDTFGDPTEEIKASLEVYAAPPKDAFGNDLPTDESGITGDIGLGIVQGHVEDGTPMPVKLTAPYGLGLTVLRPNNYSGSFDLYLRHEDGTETHYSVNYQSPATGEDVTAFLLNFNTYLLSLTDGALDATLDPSFINGFRSNTDLSTPSLALQARHEDVTGIRVVGGGAYGFSESGVNGDEQYDDRRCVGLGFSDNQSSTVESGRQVLRADLPAPVEDTLMQDTDFVVIVGSTRIRIQIDSALFYRETLDGQTLLGKVEEVVENQLNQAGLDPNLVRVDIEDGKFVFSTDSTPLTVHVTTVDKTKLSLAFKVDIVDPSYNPEQLRLDQGRHQVYFNRLTKDELQTAKSGGKLLDVFVPSLEAAAKVRLDVDANMDLISGAIEQSLGLAGGTIGLPEIKFGFNLDASAHVKPGKKEASIDKVEFDHVNLDIGSLLNTLVVPVSNVFGEALGPVFKVIGSGINSAEGYINQPIPVLSDLGFGDVTILDLPGLSNGLGSLNDVFTFVGDMASFAGGISDFMADYSGKSIAFGSFTLVDGHLVPSEIQESIDAFKEVSLDQFSDAFSSKFFKHGGLSFDILKPGQILNMLTGDTFDIVSLNLPAVDLKLGEDFGFNFGDLSFDVHAGATIHLGTTEKPIGVVYDSTGLSRIISAYRAHTSPDWSDLLDGFYLRLAGKDGNGARLPELSVDLGVGGSGHVTVSSGDVVVFDVSGEVDLGATLGIDLKDPNDDGKLRLDEIMDLTDNFTDPAKLLCLIDITASIHGGFDFSGTVAGLTLTADDLGIPTSFSYSFDLSGIFGDIGDCQHAAVLATPIVENGQNVLRLNAGPFASARIFGDTSDEDDGANFTVTQSGNTYTVTFKGATQTYTGNFDKVLAIGGSQADTFDLSGVSTPCEIRGNGGDDILTGGSGNDLIDGGAGSDTIFGNAGDDTITAGTGANTVSDGAGADTVDFSDNDVGATLTTGGGNDYVIGSRFADTFTAGGTGNVHFVGGLGNDTLTGSTGADLLEGGNGDDVLTGNDGADILIGGFGADSLDGGAGNDNLVGNQDADTIVGGPGADQIDGGEGDDTLITGLRDINVNGGSGIDSLEFRMTDEAVSATLTNDALNASVGAVPFSGVESVALTLGDFNNTITIDGPTMPVRLTGGASGDDVTIRNLPALSETTPSTMIALGGGDDTLTILDTQRIVAASGQDHGANGDHLIIDQSASPVPRVGVVNPTSVTGLGIAEVRYDTFERLDINEGEGADRITINDTDPATTTTINGAGGKDLYTVNKVSSNTVINGGADEDTVTVAITGNPNLVPANSFSNLHFDVEKLIVDNRGNFLFDANWQFIDGAVYIGTTEIVDTLGAATTIFKGGPAADTLTVQDTVDVPQTINVDGSQVRIQEGRAVLTPDGTPALYQGFGFGVTVDGLNGVSAAAVSGDGKYVYVAARDDNSVSVFQRNSDGTLSLLQVTKEGDNGATGLNHAADLVLSPDGKFVYVAGDEIAIFSRVAITGRLVYRGFFHARMEHLAISLNDGGANLYGSAGRVVTRFARDASTGMLTSVQTTPAGSNIADIAVNPDGSNLYLALDTGVGRIPLNAGQMGALVSADTGHTNAVAVSPDGRNVYFGTNNNVQLWDKALTTNSASYAIAGTPSVNALAVDPDGDRVLASVDMNSVDIPQPSEVYMQVKTFHVVTSTDQNSSSNPEDVYFKLNDVRMAYDGSLDEVVEVGSGETAHLVGHIDEQLVYAPPYQGPYGYAFKLQVWDEDPALQSDDLLESVLYTVNPNDFTPANSTLTKTFTTSDGNFSISFTLRAVFPTTPVLASPLFTFARASGGALGGGVAVAGIDPAIKKLDFLAVAPTAAGYAEQDVYGVSTPNDTILRVRSTGVVALKDGDAQTVQLAALMNTDDVRTVVTSDGKHAYSVSPKYGVLSVLPVNADGTLGAATQTISLGFTSGASLAVGFLDQWLYVTNPQEDSLLVFSRQTSNQSPDFGKLKLQQVVTDGMAGVDGIAGASAIAASSDGTHLYVAGPGDNAIAVFSRDLLTGAVTYLAKVTRADLLNPNAIVVSNLDPRFLYVTSRDSNSLLVFAQDRTTGGLTYVQTVTDGVGGVDGLSDPAALALGSDPLQQNVYVAGQGDNAIAVFSRDPASGELTFVQLVQNGVNGVIGIDGVTSVAVSADNTMVFATGSQSVAVFQHDLITGHLTIVQRLRDGSGGASGLQAPTQLLVVGNELYVSSAGPNPGAGGVAAFNITTVAPNPRSYIVQFSGMEALTVTSAAGADTVNAGEFTIPFTLNTNAGLDTVTIRNTPTAKTTTINLGDDADTLDLLSTGASSVTKVNGGAADDTINVYATGLTATTAINGNDGNDTIQVKVNRLQSTVTVAGNDPTVLPGDTLVFDAYGYTTDPVTPLPPSGSVKIAAKTFGVSYNTIEKIVIIGSPQANAGGPYTLAEGGSLTLDAGSSLIPTGATSTTYEWNVGTGIVTGVSPTLLWTDLKALGLGDSGAYQVAVKVTVVGGGQTFSDIATAPLTITNTAPTLSLSGNAAVEASSLYTLVLSATDPGADNVQSWTIDWNDSTPTETYFGNPATVQHTYAGAGAFVIQVTAQDEDGVYGPATKNLTVLTPRAISGPVTDAEGAAYALTLGKGQAGSPAVSSWGIHWGDGTSDTVAGDPSSTTHKYADNGFYIITATYVDSDGVVHQANNTVRVEILNVAPTLTPRGRSTAFEGSPYNLVLRSTDPGADAIRQWIVSWGDGQSSVVAGNLNRALHTYADNGVYTIRLGASDEDGSYVSPNTLRVTVANVAPALSVLGDAAVDEGSPYTVNLGAADPGADTIDHWTINWGDGHVETIPGSPASVSHTYANGANTYTIQASATDEDGSYAAAPLSVLVRDVPPKPTVAGDSFALEGAPYVLNLTANEPGADPITGWLINWGDGHTDTISGNPATVSHTYADGGPADSAGKPTTLYRIQATLLEGSAAYAAPALDVGVYDRSPALAAGPTSGVEGSTYSLDLTNVSDPGLDTTTRFKIYWGDGTSSEHPASSGVATHVYADDGSYAIHVFAFDEDGEHLAARYDVAIANVPPTIRLTGTAAVDENSPYALTLGPITDPGADTVSRIIVSWGDGVTQQFTATGSVSHTYKDGPATFNIQVTLIDEDGTWNGGVKQITVNNVSPTASLSGPATALPGGTLTFTLGATDPSQPDQDAGFTYAINWGDGYSQSVTGLSGKTTPHTFASAGLYTVSMTATDKDRGVSKPVTQLVAVQGMAMHGTELVIVGTQGDDVIQVNPGGGAPEIKVKLNGTQQTFLGVTRIVIHALGGNDNVQVVGGITLPTEIYGGDGNDTLRGGGGFNLIDGGAGDDVITGGVKNDVLIGGAGADTIDGGQGDDLVLGGLFLDGASFQDRQTALRSAQSTWSTSSYEARSQALRLFLAGKVADDGVADTLHGGAGQDWFFASLTGPNRDRLLDLAFGELTEPLN
ncbi:MAG: PKD domain-containing protein [Gemmataceae bacterium]